MNYQQAWDYLDSLQMHKVKLGLDSMREFLSLVGGPEKGLKYIHVAGTNGKGSVSATLLTLLSEAGYRVGLYTSPHLSSVRERFRINDAFISEEEFASIATEIRDVLGDRMITYFEFTTAIAFLWFSRSDLDLAILETGLGGRLDATNVVTPLVSVITNVSMDHELYLGDTLEAVAYEKAGIIKEKVPVISGVANDVSREVVQRACKERSAPLYLYGEQFDTVESGASFIFQSQNDQLGKIQYPNLRCSMKGDYQQINAALAIAVLLLLEKHGITCSEEDVRTGLLKVHWPGRLEYIVLEDKQDISYLLDGAHNPAGVESLVQTLKNEYHYSKLILIWGAMIDKDLSKTLSMIAPLADHIVFARLEGERSAEPEQFLDVIDQDLKDRCTMIRDAEQALNKATDMAQKGDMVVIAGSLYLVGAIRRMLVGELVE